MLLSPEEFEMLWHDKAYGILTRPAIEIKFNRRAENNFDWVVFIDLDNIHIINEANAVNGSNGYEATDALIRKVFSTIVRETDLYTFVDAGRHMSGDEIVFYVAGDPEEFCRRLQQNLNAEGLSATMAYTNPRNTYEETVRICAAKVQAAKRANQRGTIEGEL